MVGAQTSTLCLMSRVTTGLNISPRAAPSPISRCTPFPAALVVNVQLIPNELNYNRHYGVLRDPSTARGFFYMRDPSFERDVPSAELKNFEVKEENLKSD